MALREVCLIGEPVLRAVAVPVAQFDQDLAELIADMFETMYAAPGRGLAAPQVGVSSRVFVTDVTWKNGPQTPIAFVNPEIFARAEDVVTGPEACLSIPDRAFDVNRPAWVAARWLDAHGAAQTARFEGPQAICFCHELDHLNGVLITDHGVER
ncbi:peptide deformylase [Cognatiyoonia sp. IB215446]|uniref:peptide deformylase n=1 Tax=Cognatiyoonia sp. IB215446 TaxID=3097355 RepID=UPI002A108AC8|nr:peptide deformylase [Cognatiyoonia sp. IB215446]MDX8346792.1 peptide deformylase [Cognatiyoonia sp. IB215446]